MTVILFDVSPIWGADSKHICANSCELDGFVKVVGQSVPRLVDRMAGGERKTCRSMPGHPY
jgi:hypothetical protein